MELRLIILAHLGTLLLLHPTTSATVGLSQDPCSEVGQGSLFTSIAVVRLHKFLRFLVDLALLIELHVQESRFQ